MATWAWVVVAVVAVVLLVFVALVIAHFPRDNAF
jgi:hypothetical protein